MKVAFCLCLLIATGNSFEWLKKREINQGVTASSRCPGRDVCLEMLRQLFDILRTPSFNLLVNEYGQLNLNCSAPAISEARGCRYPCAPRLLTRVLAVWEHICENKEVVEDLDDCLNVVNPVSAVQNCEKMIEDAQLQVEMSECIVTQVATQEPCDEVGGRLISQIYQYLTL